MIWIPNVILLSISIVISLYVANLISQAWVNSLYQVKFEFVQNWKFFKENIEKIEEMASPLHHTRSPIRRESGEYNLTDLLFKEYSSFSRNKTNILIQGDSWAAMADEQGKTVLRDISEREDIGLINAGTTSFAPIMMDIQLTILKERFRFEPNIIVAIVDQTDLGDTFCRYRAYVGKRVDVKTHRDSFYPPDVQLDRAINITSDKFPLVKVLIGIKLYIKRVIYFRNSGASWNCISEPLVSDISKRDRDIFINTLDNYVKTIFGNEDMRMVYFVTHPHSKHRDGQYKLDVGTLISKFIKNSEYRDRICHIDFSRIFDEMYSLTPGIDNVFRRGDKSSHLSDSAYRDVFLPKIFSIVENGQCKY